MNYHPKKRLTAADIILIAVIASVTAFLFLRPLIFRGESGSYFSLTTDGGTESYSLSQDCTMTVESNGITLTVKVADGKVSVAESSCPDRICCATGQISQSGEAIVCIPAEVVIRIGEGGAGDEDITVG